MHALWMTWLAVYPNLIASGVCTAVVWVKVHLHLRRLHQRLDQLDPRKGVCSCERKEGLS